MPCMAESYCGIGHTMNLRQRRDQRTVLLRSTGCWFVPVPLSTPPVALRKTVRSSRAPFVEVHRSSGGFRLRLGSGRCAPASFLYALHSSLRSTFPLADTQTEAECSRFAG